ncbi:hypothetical protein TRVL_10321 [Trypanosoma vivax]|nr:hypothetical protein TRVL_10321 [Trypanosoma vivax]
MSVPGVECTEQKNADAVLSVRTLPKRARATVLIARAHFKRWCGWTEGFCQLLEQAHTGRSLVQCRRNRVRGRDCCRHVKKCVSGSGSLSLIVLSNDRVGLCTKRTA